MSTKFSITKENADLYLYEFAKEYKKKTRVPLEIVLVGGVAIILKYNFRIMSMDYDVLFDHRDSYLKQCINNIADKFDLPTDWLNDDFKKSDSYSPKLYQYSRYYKTYRNVVNVRIVDREYLLAMKLVAGRNYKHDLSDIVGILIEEKNNNNPVSKEEIYTALMNLYGTTDIVSDEMKQFLDDIYAQKDLEQFFNETVDDEIAVRTEMMRISNSGPGAIPRGHFKDVANEVKKRILSEKKK